MPIPPPETSRLLLQLLPAIRAYVARRVEPGAVDDITQTVLLRTWRRLAAADALPIDSPRRYLYRSAHNAVIDHYRRRHRHQTVALEALSEEAAQQPPPQEQAVADTLDRERLQQLLPGLPPAQREIVRQRFLEHRSVAEVSRLTGRSPNAVSVLSVRAKRRLQAVP